MLIRITDDAAIRAEDLRWTAARSGGAGGQNVNKVSTKAILVFDVKKTTELTAEQKARILERLAARINRDGMLRVTSQRHRTLGANRRAALERLVELLREALAETAPRTPTRPTRAARDRRLAAKKRRGAVKRIRGARPTTDM